MKALVPFAILLAISALLGCKPSSTDSQPLSPAVAFQNPTPVNISGYTGEVMEPFISKDGQYLFFNNRNDPADQTDLFYAQRQPDGSFTFQGEVVGANQNGILDAVASMTTGGVLYFTTIRDYSSTYISIFSGSFSNGQLTNVLPVQGSYCRYQPGWLVMDVEVSADGTTVYFSDAFFNGGPVPATCDIGVAARQPNGMNKLSNSAELLQAINTPGDLEYAPCVSANGLELYFTRLNLTTLQTISMVSTRENTSAPFGTPERLQAITGFAEAPSLSFDGKTLYYHLLVNNQFKLYKVTRSL